MPFLINMFSDVCRSSKRTRLVDRALTQVRLLPKHALMGFTLVELMVTIAVVSILLIWGVPSLQRSIDSQSLRSAVSEFRSALSIARYESAGQGRRLVIAKNCALDASHTPRVCNDSWSKGFQIFVCRSTVDDTTKAMDGVEDARKKTLKECAETPELHATTEKQSFEGYHNSIKICDRGAAGELSNASTIVFNPSGDVFYTDLSTLTTKQVLGIDFYMYIERGNNPGDDLVHLISMSAGGQTTVRQIYDLNIDSSTLACET